MGRAKRFDSTLTTRIKKMRSEGVSDVKIALYFNVSPKTIRNYIGPRSEK